MDEHLPSTLQVIGMEWKQRSRELAEWAMVRLVNRKDVWGQYTGLSQRRRGQKALTLPQKSMRGQDMVTIEKLAVEIELMEKANGAAAGQAAEPRPVSPRAPGTTA